MVSIIRFLAFTEVTDAPVATSVVSHDNIFCDQVQREREKRRKRERERARMRKMSTRALLLNGWSMDQSCVVSGRGCRDRG